MRLIALAAIASATLTFVPLAAADFPTGTISTYTDPSMNIPYGIAAGPDGALWFTNEGNNTIGRISTDGDVTSYSDPSINGPFEITTGPDGALWFTNLSGNTIGRITTDGVVTSYSDPSINGPWGITAGPDGAVWFTNVYGHTIGRIGSDGVVTSYNDPGVYPHQIVAGPDGALWFTTSNNAVGRITTDGVVTNYSDPAISHRAMGIAVGSDSALWFANHLNGIGRISTDGAITGYGDPSIGAPYAIAAGPDGALWFGTSTCNEIGRISMGGAVSTFGNNCIALAGAAAGPDGGVWFTTSGGNTIERIQPAPPLLGNADLEPRTDYNPDGMAEAFRTTAAANGTLGSLSIYLDPTSTATTVDVGLYSSVGGRPSTLLAQATLEHPISGNWNVVSLPATAVTAGKRYWIALLTPTGAGTVQFRDLCCGDSGPLPSQTSAQQDLTALPSIWQTGTVYSNDGPLSAYGN